MNTNTIQTQSEQKYVGKSEFVFYLMAVFFYTMMTGRSVASKMHTL